MDMQNIYNILFWSWDHKPKTTAEDYGNHMSSVYELKANKNMFHFSLSNLSSLLKYYPFTCAKPVQNNKLTSITSYIQMTWNHCLKIQTARHSLTNTYKCKKKGSKFTELSLNFRNSTKYFYEYWLQSYCKLSEFRHIVGFFYDIERLFTLGQILITKSSIVVLSLTSQNEFHIPKYKRTLWSLALKMKVIPLLSFFRVLLLWSLRKLLMKLRLSSTGLLAQISLLTTKGDSICIFI